MLPRVGLDPAGGRRALFAAMIRTARRTRTNKDPRGNRLPDGHGRLLARDARRATLESTTAGGHGASDDRKRRPAAWTLLVAATLAALLAFGTIGRNLAPIVRTGYRSLTMPGRPLADSDLDPFTFYASTRALSGARAVIPPNATYSGSWVGTSKPVLSDLPGHSPEGRSGHASRSPSSSGSKCPVGTSRWAKRNGSSRTTRRRKHSACEQPRQSRSARTQP